LVRDSTFLLVNRRADDFFGQDTVSAHGTSQQIAWLKAHTTR
jgi:hypothetical protein